MTLKKIFPQGVGAPLRGKTNQREKSYIHNSLPFAKLQVNAQKNIQGGDEL
jgi:hypothetical protein